MALRMARALSTTRSTLTLTDLRVKLVVFDMAGTVIDEGGIVYETLKTVLRRAGISFTNAQFDRFHGANKKEVIAHFVNERGGSQAEIDRLFVEFTHGIEEAYFKPGSPVRPFPNILPYFDQLRKAGIKVGLDTGYPRSIAGHLIRAMNFDSHIDGSLVSEEVGFGRPYPYMIHGLMRQLQVQNVREVVKVGDTALDMQEGQNAGCTTVIGVLSGADNEETLRNNGATSVVNFVTDIVIDR